MRDSRHRERSAAIHGGEPPEKAWTATAFGLAVTSGCSWRLPRRFAPRNDEAVAKFYVMNSEKDH
jgi:hypothetical protein